MVEVPSKDTEYEIDDGKPGDERGKKPYSDTAVPKVQR